LVETINSIYTTSWVHSGLSCGQDFHYLIKSFNEWGDSAAPNLVAVSTPACFVQPAPEAPTFVYITTDKESATVGWQDNSDNEDDFYISVNQSGTNVMNVVAPANTTMYTIEGLTCETTYEFMVYARNSSGLSSGSGYSIETQRCEGPIPNAPSHLDAYIIQQNQLTLSWHDNSEIEEDYQFQYKQRYSIEDYQTTSLPANSTGIVIDGLLCGTEYELKVTVRNFENDIYYTSSVTEYEFTFGNCPIETPTDTAVETTQTTAYVTWTDNSHNEDSFIVYAELAGEVVSSVTTEANVESATLTGLSCGLRYKFYVRGSNAERMSPYWEVYEYTNQCDDEVPYAPTNLHAVNISKDSVLIAWDDNSSVEDHFEIFENVGYYIFIDEVGENITNYTITGLDCEIDYIFRVYAVNENGFTGSNFLSVKTESCTTEVEDIFIFLPTITR